jgi:hypothetical protein
VLPDDPIQWTLVELHRARLDGKAIAAVRPFASHPRWLKWAQNTCERHRLNGQKDVCLFNDPEGSSNVSASCPRVRGGAKMTPVPLLMGHLEKSQGFGR